ncbi:isocitrate lyase/PEP mutase family protein [Pseudochryseolinea flava]|uniref:Isocitrate lyase/phosphoenolpyruvate mutase family protein n=1 Tax=Pseudochryseolinea flava TaxID=2059302 RepID=A0A364XY55_9BACT|nr:isocitrate lyase/phosphoenolpyruvate mutase family protein [Pseudochryseolinea flava]RAV98500.1 isocitrate lyase/phosphoenolpyruvate mutase family protein [Pseudochryseolinea flava]
MSERFKKFSALHHQASPLLIGNVWNVQSATVFETQQFKAIATSSAAVAATLGFRDGESMPFSAYLQIVGYIARATTLPLSVDLEAGYGETVQEIVSNIKQLADVGVVGINIEDSRVANGKREFVDSIKFSQLLEGIVSGLRENSIDMFVNVRCDAFLLGVPDALHEAVRRTKSYQVTGVNGLFFPCITDLSDIRAVVDASTLPVNVMCMPGLPSFDVLKGAGVKRISMGNFFNSKVYQSLADNVSRIVSEEKFDSLF